MKRCQDDLGVVAVRNLIYSIFLSAIVASLSGCVTSTGSVFGFHVSKSSKDGFFSSLCVSLLKKGYTIEGWDCSSLNLGWSEITAGHDTEQTGDWSYLPVFYHVSNSRILIQIRYAEVNELAELTFLESGTREYSALGEKSYTELSNLVKQKASKYFEDKF
jgi:hypothetical protein